MFFFVSLCHSFCIFMLPFVTFPAKKLQKINVYIRVNLCYTIFASSGWAVPGNMTQLHIFAGVFVSFRRYRARESTYGCRFVMS